MSIATRNSTTTLLLEGLLDPANASTWQLFHERYHPVILGFARRLGLNDADAADVAQETLARFLVEYRAGKYDRSRGRLGTWIVALARWSILDFRRSRAGRRERDADSRLGDLPDDAGLTQLWEAEHRTCILRRALEELRTGTRTDDTTLRAFELYVLDERPVGEVAATLSITPGDVYTAKSRIAQRLREIIGRIEMLYCED